MYVFSVRKRPWDSVCGMRSNDLSRRFVSLPAAMRQYRCRVYGTPLARPEGSGPVPKGGLWVVELIVIMVDLIQADSGYATCSAFVADLGCIIAAIPSCRPSDTWCCDLLGTPRKMDSVCAA